MTTSTSTPSLPPMFAQPSVTIAAAVTTARTLLAAESQVLKVRKPNGKTNRREPAGRYSGRSPREVRATQHVVSFIKGRDLTAAERGAVRVLCSPSSSR